MAQSKLSSASFQADGTSTNNVIESETSETIKQEQPGSMMKGSNPASQLTTTEEEPRVNDEKEPNEKGAASFILGVQIPHQFARYTWHVTVVLAGMIIIAPRRFFWGVVHLVQTMIGVTLGIGLGLGLAMHVYEQLQSLHRAHHHETQQGQAAGTPHPSKKRLSKKGSEGGSSFGGAGVGVGGGPMMTESMTRSKQGGSSILEDGNTYLSLMAASGYYIEDKIIRAQVVRANSDFWRIRYPFTGVPVQQQKGALLLQDDWPSLPRPITIQLGRFVEHVMRDYVSTWYTKMDAGCVYRDERELRAKGQPRDGGDDLVGEGNTVTEEEGTALRDEGGGGGSAPTTPSKSSTDARQQHLQQHQQRLMVFSTQRHRRIPMLDQTYRVLSVAFGNLATRAEHVNLFSLAMLKWTQVLAHTFKVYRTLRKVAMDKNVEAQKRLQNNGTGGSTSNSTNLNRNKAAAAAASFASAAMNVNAAEPKPQPPTEVQVAREFLLAGKLHCAVTFGLDVPSLLFADANGQECGTGTAVNISATTSATSPTKTPSSFSKNDKEVQDKILAERLFQTTMLKECELDYNRVVAYRLCRALLPRTEFASTVLSALIVEIFAGCVLQPLMGIFTPLYLNGWIIAGMAKKKGGKSAAADNEKTEKAPAAAVDDKPPDKIKGGGGSNEAAATVKETSVEIAPGLQEEAALVDELNNETKASVSGDAGLEEGDFLEDPLPTPLELDLDDDGFTGGQYIDEDEEDDEVVDVLEGEGPNVLAENEAGDKLLTLAAMTLIQLQQHVDFEACRVAKLNHQEEGVDWDDPTCQVWVVRLVLVLEAAVLDGRCKYVEDAKVMDDSVDTSRDDSGDIANEVPMYESLSQVLMELTADIDGFESRVDAINKEKGLVKKNPRVSTRVADYEPEPSEISTLRTLISTWLHTGQLYRSLSVLIKAHGSFLSAFYSPSAFLGNPNSAEGFVRQMKLLDGVDVMVDTMAVLASARLDPEQADESMPTMLPSPRRSIMETPPREGPARVLSFAEARNPLGGRLGQGFGMLKTNIANRLAEQQQPREQQHHRESQQEPPTTPTEMATYMGDLSTPRHLDFSRNAAFASSLRDERERRMRSWETRKADTTVQTVFRKGASAADIDLHTELHSVARIFYNGTNVMAIRDAARRKDSEDSDPGGEGTDKDGQSKVSLLTVEMVSNRRRIEVPDDDSSFLLRAQPRPLNPVSVHRDDRNHDLSYKCFLSTFEEPAFPPGSNRYNGGRYIRRCLIQYFPIDRTSAVMMHNDRRRLDKRKAKQPGADQSASKNETPYLNGAFLRQRHLCQKWTPKGATAQSFLSSSVMELSDFNATPRSGKALDFIFRMSLFECPTVELGGKRFTVQDSTGRGPHRADASSLEVSDASLSALLLSIGQDWVFVEKNEEDSNGTPSKPNEVQNHHKVEMGPDGYPMIFMKFSRKQGDKVSVEIKPYRLSFVRAALLVTSARQEAQLQCLMDCVRAGSAKSATKARTELLLKPTLKILQFANDKSPDKARASSLFRDLKLGIYHIDREQLRRNGLLNPRHPTILKDLVVRVDGAFQAKDVLDASALGTHLQPTTTVYKLVCSALVELNTAEEMDHLEPYMLQDGTVASHYWEEWIVFRPMKDFQSLHKHIKGQVAYTEASASTGSRLVGVAAAAFSNASQGRRQRKALVPSLAQANKTASIAVTRKALMKRGELLDEYVEHFLNPEHLLSRCTEILLFVGAFFPFPSEVRVGYTPTTLVDPMGRTNLLRRVDTQSALHSSLKSEPGDSQVESPTRRNKDLDISPNKRNKDLSVSNLSLPMSESKQQDDAELEEDAENNGEMLESILNKVDQVPLAEVRNRMVELVRYQFGFENASFFRSRLLSALETASFVAVTKATDFRKVLYDLHLQHLSPESLANWIKLVLNLLWPDGVWMTTAPTPTPEEERKLAETSRESLDEGFPEQIRSILGRELTKDGMDMLHEMLQNRLVVKSLFYMLFDMLWIEIFPELRDVLTCASALDIE